MSRLRGLLCNKVFLDVSVDRQTHFINFVIIIHSECSRVVILYAANKMLVRLAAPAHLRHRAAKDR